MPREPTPDCYEHQHCWDSTAAPREIDQQLPEICLTAPARFQDSSECLGPLVSPVTHGAVHRTRLHYGSCSPGPDRGVRALRASRAANGSPLGNIRWLLAPGFGGNG